MLPRNILQLSLRKREGGQVKPANQCKLFIVLSLISGIKTGSILGKASFKLSDISLLFSTALIDTIWFKPYKVKCFPSCIKLTTSLKSI